MKRYLKWWLVLVLVLIALAILIITLGRGDTSKNRRIAEDLLQLKGGWGAGEISTQNLTNLPIHDSLILEPPSETTSGKIAIGRNYNLVVMHLEEYYFLENSTTNSSEWTLYHYWDWHGQRPAIHTLLTIVETNSPLH